MAEPPISETATDVAANAASDASIEEYSAKKAARVAAAIAASEADHSLDSLITTTMVGLLVPALIMLFVIYLSTRAKSGRGHKLVICGPVGGGKSAIYHQLRFGRVVPTVSSMMAASATFVPIVDAEGNREGKAAEIVDVPGSGRLRVQLLEEAANASALLCVVDGTQIAQQAREAAGMLFEVLSHDSIARRKLPVLVAVNKADVPGAATPVAAQKAIEQEVQRVRLARTTMADTSGRDKMFRGIAEDDGKPFTFDSLENNAVSFAATSATKPDLSAVHKLCASLR